MPSHTSKVVYSIVCTVSACLILCPSVAACLTFKCVQKELWKIRYKWQQIGIELNFLWDDLKNVQCKFGNDPDKCLPELIDKWLKRSQPKAAWDVLVRALKEPQVGEEGVADDISTKYQL